MASLRLRIRGAELWELLSEHIGGDPKSVRMRTAVARACVLQERATGAPHGIGNRVQSWTLISDKSCICLYSIVVSNVLCR